MENMQQNYQPSENQKINDNIYKTSIDGLYFLPHKVFHDDRGFYREMARIHEIEEVLGHKFEVKQLNQSQSKTNVIRGIHAEDWNKLVTVTSGLCFCAIVDLRPESNTFGKYEAFLLGTELEALFGSIFISKGLGNSLCVVKGPADYIYAVDAVWSERDKSGDIAIALFDQDINIQWPISTDKMIYSERDKNAITLKERFR